jgi:prepilin-type N-terminal cleavage/methylation domain-containing protein
MRCAFTLPEMVLVLAVGGLLIAIAIPPLSWTVDRIEVEAAANHIVAAHQRARIFAVTHSVVVVLSIDPAQLSIRTRGETAPLWSEPGPEASGVTLAGPSRQFTFAPEGFTVGLSNASLQLTRGSSYRTVVVSRLGRVRIMR